MKKLITILIIVVVLATLVLTCPDKQRHVEAINDEFITAVDHQMNESYSSEEDGDEEDGSFEEGMRLVTSSVVGENTRDRSASQGAERRAHFRNFNHLLHASVLPFIRVIRVIRGLISCVSHNLIVPLAAPKVLRHGCAGKKASTFSCVSHNLIVPLSQIYGNA